MKHRKTQLAAAVGAALLLGAGAVQAQNLQVQVYGQVNRALMFVDDETQSKWFHVDGQPSSTRFGIQGTAQATPGLRVGARIESEMKSNPSDVVTFANASTGNPAGAAVNFAERWLDATFEGSWGRINLGQGSGAADDASTIDISGTSIANGVCICDWGGAISFNDSAGVPIATIKTTIDNLDFESRYDRAMYTTPVFGGFRAQAGFGQRAATDEATEFSLWYSGKLGGDFQAAIGYSKVNTTPEQRKTFGGSVSWLHTSGFNITAAYTDRDLGGATTRSASHWYIKPGYKFGPHAISFGYFQGDDQAAQGDTANAYALAYVWNPIRWAEIYATYILYSLDRTGVSASDVTVGVVGTRIRF